MNNNNNNKRIQFFVATTPNRYKKTPYDMKPFDKKTFLEIIEDVNSTIYSHFGGGGKKYLQLYKAALYVYNLSHIEGVEKDVISNINDVLLDISAFVNDGRKHLEKLIYRKEEIFKPTISSILFNIFYLMKHPNQKSVKEDIKENIFDNRCLALILDRGVVNDDESLFEKMKDHVINRNEEILNCDPRRFLASRLFESSGERVPPPMFPLMIDGYKNELQSLIPDDEIGDIIKFDSKLHQVIELNQDRLSSILSTEEFKEKSKEIRNEIQVKMDSVETQKSHILRSNIDRITEEVSDSAMTILHTPADVVHKAIQVWFQKNMYPSELYIALGYQDYLKDRIDGNFVLQFKGEEEIQILTPAAAKFIHPTRQPLAVAQVEQKQGRLTFSHREIPSMGRWTSIKV